MTTPASAQISASDFNLEKLTTKDLSEHIAGTIQVNGNIAVFGRRGTGKTMIARQEIKRSKLKEVYLNLSVFERTDLAGFPSIMSNDPKRKFVDFLLPRFYESMIEGSEGVVALLDEVDKADPSLWAPLLEFTQFKSINGKHLPNLKAIIMTGNLISEGGSRPSLPLLDRTEKYLIEADVASWVEWAGKDGHIHPSIIAYILDNPRDLFGAVDPEDRYSDPSPRGWASASYIIYKGEEYGWSNGLINKKVSGCIGKDAGIKYSSYFEYYLELLPMIDDLNKGIDIIEEYNQLEPTKQIVACMIACGRLATQLDQSSDEELPKSLKYIGKFLQRVSPENVLVAIRCQIQNNRIIKYSLDKHTDWKPIFSNISSDIF